MDSITTSYAPRLTHPILHFFNVLNVNDSPERVSIELSLLPATRLWRDKATGILAQVIDMAVNRAGNQSIGDCTPVELELFMHCTQIPDSIKVEASVEFVCEENALFQCQIYSAQDSSDELIAASHGTLKQTKA
ncbi:hypothetical protein [Glaciecola sp. 1036]|uniref:hypothetical protein n=1 Tax=Alteromonadaceae TaxID=72275 RepID=UPI003D08ACD8